MAAFFIFIQVGCYLWLPTITAGLVDNGIVAKDMAYIWRGGLLMLGVAALSLIVAFGNIYYAATQAMGAGKKLRKILFQHVLEFSGNEMTKFGDATLITRSTNDVVQIQTVFVQLLRLLMQSQIMLVAAIILAYFRRAMTDDYFLNCIANFSHRSLSHHAFSSAII